MNFSSQYFKHTLYQKIAYCRLETTCNDGLTLCHGDLSCNDDVGTGRRTAGGMGGELRNSFLRESFPQWYPPHSSTLAMPPYWLRRLRKWWWMGHPLSWGVWGGGRKCTVTTLYKTCRFLRGRELQGIFYTNTPMLPVG
jgi:hypothetical protein